MEKATRILEDYKVGKLTDEECSGLIRDWSKEWQQEQARKKKSILNIYYHQAGIALNSLKEKIIAYDPDDCTLEQVHCLLEDIRQIVHEVPEVDKLVI